MVNPRQIRDFAKAAGQDRRPRCGGTGTLRQGDQARATIPGGCGHLSVERAGGAQTTADQDGDGGEEPPEESLSQHEASDPSAPRMA